jgi:hypothetical protein
MQIDKYFTLLLHQGWIVNKWDAQQIATDVRRRYLDSLPGDRNSL